MKSVHEMALEYANTIYKQLNQSAVATMGVDVLWFRAVPDKKNQDVIFQTYTLYGVEDCPLEFKAIYTDTNYDDAAMTFNIMGISYAIPMSLEVDVDTWKNVTNNDGTLPQQYDIVYIPLTQKLLEVASMSPIKKIGGQLTSYKMNLSAYKPKRNRILGDNLKESIEENTVNRDSLFGTDIENALKDIVDNHQLDLNTSTPSDKYKNVNATSEKDSIIKNVKNIIKHNLVVDGHTVARNYYDMSYNNDVCVKYTTNDIFSVKDNRTFSCWLQINDIDGPQHIKNLKDALLVAENENGTFITAKIGSKFKKGDNVVIKRGMIKIPGVVVGTGKIKVNKSQIQKLSIINSEWYNVPGFVITNDQTICIFKSDNLEISIKGGCFIAIVANGSEKLIQLSSDLKHNEWLGIMIGMSGVFSIDVFSANDKLKHIESISSLKNDLYTELSYNNPYIPNGQFKITNIRMCKGVYNDIDSKILEFISYHVKNDSQYIINDDALTYLNKNFVGEQR